MGVITLDNSLFQDFTHHPADQMNRESFERRATHVPYCDIMKFTVLQNRHHKESQSVAFFMHCKTVTILLGIWVRGHLMMSITKNHESHYVTVLDNPPLAQMPG